ncbi:hypothetical protein EDB89DRAFT_1902269 [Lactarius sanguifluus]|nr:hypothetical protein EDB89DRAFT_1902269 [Lactarius sanguifluus]
MANSRRLSWVQLGAALALLAAWAALVPPGGEFAVATRVAEVRFRPRCPHILPKMCNPCKNAQRPCSGALILRSLSDSGGPTTRSSCPRLPGESASKVRVQTRLKRLFHIAAVFANPPHVMIQIAAKARLALLPHACWGWRTLACRHCTHAQEKREWTVTPTTTSRFLRCHTSNLEPSESPTDIDDYDNRAIMTTITTVTTTGDNNGNRMTSRPQLQWRRGNFDDGGEGEGDRRQ